MFHQFWRGTLAVAAGPQRVLVGDVSFGGGATQNVGDSFDVSFATATNDAVVARMLAAGQTGGIPSSAWPPAGVTEFGRVTVVRKKTARKAKQRGKPR